MDYNQAFGENTQALTEKELVECFKKYRKGDSNAREILIIHNIRLISLIVKSYESIYYETDELISVGMIGLIKSVDTYDLDKNTKFSSYASSCIRNELFMYFKKNNKHTSIRSLKEVVTYDNDGKKLLLEDVIHDEKSNFVEEYEDNETYKIVRNIVEELPSDERFIIMNYYGFTEKIISQQEIAGILGISQTAVSKKIKKILKKIQNELQSYEIYGNVKYRNKKMIPKK